MNYQTIFYDNMLNGEGLRVVLWLSGCNHNCLGCHNPETHDPQSGKLFDKEAEEKIFNELKKDYISGITLSGGDPMFIANKKEVTLLAQKIKQLFPDKTIWMYTGYEYEQIADEPIIKDGIIDVLCDGKFIQSLHDGRLQYVGSSNQRIIDIKETLKNGKITLKIDNEVNYG